MKITYQTEYLSITQFNEVDVKNFIVLTGVNGSGKSHLLDAIERKKVLIDNSASLRIVKFNFETFRLENESSYNAQQISSERETAWSFFANQIKPNVESWKNAIGDSYKPIVEQCHLEKKAFWKAVDQPLEAYKTSVKNLFNQDHVKTNQSAIGVYSLLQQLPFSIDEIKQEKFVALYKPFSAKQDFLPMALGKVIWDYYIKYRSNQINEFENAKHGKNYPVLSEEEFIEAHGDKPWDVINSILKSFNSLEYRVNSPEGSDYFGNFSLKLVHIGKEGLEIDFSSLSSGERVLMALVASIYKSSSDNYFPDILLLDELDASLHPSMMKNMLTVIRDVFLSKGVKVILVTHSPTTIALSPEESIFVMNRSGLNRIEKRSRSEALSILTEGFATLEEGLLLFDEVTKNQISILTEGKNVVLLQRAIDLGGLHNEVVLIEGAEAVSGKTQLKTLFDFFSRVPHANKVVFVWDCDATYELSEINNTYPFVLEKNPLNLIASKGIENIFPTELFGGFLKTITLSQGKVITEFDESRKRDFEEHVLARKTDADFINFDPLIQKLRSLLGR